MILTDLAAVCRRTGLRVVEVPGWRSRGHGQFRSIEAIVCHHTGSAATAKGDYPSLRVVRDGRPDLAGPLSQLGLGRSGTVYVIAAGVAWHAGLTHAAWQNNWHSIGIEAEHPGRGPWPAVQFKAYVQLCATLRAAYSLHIDRIVAHKEICRPTGRKPDPNFGMDAFRALVRSTPATRNPTGEDDMPYSEAQLRQMIQAELEEYNKRFWADDTGTGTGLLRKLDKISAQLDALAKRESL